MAKVYGKQAKALVMPHLPEDCKAKTDATDDAGKAAVAGGFDTVISIELLW